MKAVLFLIFALLSLACAHNAESSGSFQNPSTFHVVRSGETLSKIGKDFQVSWQELASLNNISQPDFIQPGQRLLIPLKNQSLVQGMDHDHMQCDSNQKEIRAYVPENHSVHNHLFSWPLQGRLTSPYGLRGERMHQGIDIAAPTGSAIQAAASGKVIYAGWIQGYGLTVILEHDGYRTLYAHASKLEVTQGQRVQQGSIIAKVGSTGRSTGPHLHFEIQRGTVAVNPLDHLGQKLVAR